jgi:hypothetical protein
MMRSISKITVKFAPLQTESRSARYASTLPYTPTRTFLYKITASKSIESNPKAIIETIAKDDVTQPSIVVQYCLSLVG